MDRQTQQSFSFPDHTPFFQNLSSSVQNRCEKKNRCADELANPDFFHHRPHSASSAGEYSSIIFHGEFRSDRPYSTRNTPASISSCIPGSSMLSPTDRPCTDAQTVTPPEYASRIDCLTSEPMISSHTITSGDMVRTADPIPAVRGYPANTSARSPASSM